MDVQNMFSIMEWPTDGHKLSIHHLKYISEPVKSWNSFQPGDEGMSRYPGSRDLWPFKILAVGASRKSLQPAIENLLKQKTDSEVSEGNVLAQQSDMDKENEDLPQQKNKKKRKKRVLMESLFHGEEDVVDEEVKKMAMTSAIKALLSGRGTVSTPQIESEPVAIDVPTTSLSTTVSSLSLSSNVKPVPSTAPSQSNYPSTALSSSSNSPSNTVLSQSGVLSTTIAPIRSESNSVPSTASSQSNYPLTALSSSSNTVLSQSGVLSTTIAPIRSESNSVPSTASSQSNYPSTALSSSSNTVLSQSGVLSTTIAPIRSESNSVPSTASSQSNYPSTALSSSSNTVLSQSGVLSTTIAPIRSESNSVPSTASSQSNYLSTAWSSPSRCYSVPSNSYSISSLLSPQSNFVSRPICPTPLSALPLSHPQSAFTMQPIQSHNISQRYDLNFPSFTDNSLTSQFMTDAHSTLYPENTYNMAYAEGSEQCHSCCNQILKLKSDLAELKYQQETIIREMAVMRGHGLKVTTEQGVHVAEQPSHVVEQLARVAEQPARIAEQPPHVREDVQMKLVDDKTKEEIDEIAKTAATLTDAVKLSLNAAFTIAELTSSSVKGQQQKKADRTTRPGLDESKRNYIESVLCRTFHVTVQQVRAKIRDRMKLLKRQYCGLNI